MAMGFPRRGVLTLALAAACCAIPLEKRAKPLLGLDTSIIELPFTTGSTMDIERDVASITPGGVWMKGEPQSKSGNETWATSLFQYRAKYGFYMHTFSSGAACKHLLRNVRRHYPGEPIYIMSDGGKNFSGLCRELGNCEFAWRPPANDRWNPMPFFNRFREAARWLNTMFVVMLEPDNEFRSNITSEPQFDAGGLNDANPDFSKGLQDYIESKGRQYSGNKNFSVAWKAFGLAGGSYFSTAAVLDTFLPDEIDWHKLRELDQKRIFSSDVAMPIALACHGYTYYPWADVTQQRFGLNASAALRHYGRDEKKPHYGEQLTKLETQTLVTDEHPAAIDVTCQGCVWVSDAECLKHTPIQCITTGHDMGPPYDTSHAMLA